MNTTTSILIFTLMLSAPLAAHAASTMPAAPKPTQPAPTPSTLANQASVQGIGLVKAIDTTRDAITVRHEPIAALGWPAMTMMLKVVSPHLLVRVKVGDRVRFTLQPDGAYSVITSIIPMKP